MDRDVGEEKIREILRTCHVLAIVGMSRDPDKASGRVPRYLEAREFTVVPVNPNAKTIEGRKSCSNLSEVKENIDAVVIFRPSEEVLPVVEEAVMRKKQRGDLRVVWMQEGTRDETAARLAEGHGLSVIQDRCMAKEYWRLFEGN